MKGKNKRGDAVLVMVYGTLKRGNKNQHYMRGAYEYLGEGETVRRNLLMINMTGRLGHWFPGAVEFSRIVDPRAGSVKGEVYLIPDKLLRQLDMHEGCYRDAPRRGNHFGYYRRRLKVRLDSGPTVVAEVYLMTTERAESGFEGGGNIVEGGDWQEPEDARRERLARVDDAFATTSGSIINQPTALALARARTRFRGRGR